MKKIISGKKYDTATARPVAEWDSGNPGDFSYIEETLYRKRTGEYFIAGEGGPASKYAESRGQNSWTGGSAIIPLDFDRAREWTEEHATADAYESEFGEVAEDDSKVVKTYSLTTATADIIARKAAEAGITQSALVERMAARL